MTHRSAVNIGCSGSIASLTPAASACGARSAIASATRARAPSMSLLPAGSPPETSTSTGAPSVAASSMARRFSSRQPSALKKPPRHRVVTSSPASRTSLAVRARPYSATGSRHRPMPGTPAATQPATTSGSGQCFVVAWLREKRRNAVRSPVTGPPPRR